MTSMGKSPRPRELAGIRKYVRLSCVNRLRDCATRVDARAKACRLQGDFYYITAILFENRSLREGRPGFIIIMEMSFGIRCYSGIKLQGNESVLMK